MVQNEHKYVAGFSLSQEKELRKTAEKLGMFESGETELSLRRSVPLTRLAIKRTKEDI